jgi:hypothetical protein
MCDKSVSSQALLTITTTTTTTTTNCPHHALNFSAGSECLWFLHDGSVLRCSSHSAFILYQSADPVGDCQATQRPGVWTEMIQQRGHCTEYLQGERPAALLQL